MGAVLAVAVVQEHVGDEGIGWHAGVRWPGLDYEAMNYADDYGAHSPMAERRIGVVIFGSL